MTRNQNMWWTIPVRDTCVLCGLPSGSPEGRPWRTPSWIQQLMRVPDIWEGEGCVEPPPGTAQLCPESDQWGEPPSPHIPKEGLETHETGPQWPRHVRSLIPSPTRMGNPKNGNQQVDQDLERWGLLYNHWCECKRWCHCENSLALRLDIETQQFYSQM